ncbi:hypothetical protein ACMD2_09712 [Ananas comosus]|uniref:Uncharacterized protein n=1 Tax=Ananas comosus TaxID=4615 RepID=A0A199VXG7_ANACO|nr:hypothetical protein ACMD2_09712 [Ananas comosus]
MPLTRLVADAFGLATVTLGVLFIILSLLCIFQCGYFHIRIQRGALLQLGYFNGPWVTRIALILIAIWWTLGEAVRLTFLKKRLFSSLLWQKDVCKAYIISNLGFAEPCIFLSLGFLLHASLQKRESGTLSPRWNKRTIGYTLLFGVPVLVIQTLIVFFGPTFINKENSEGRTKMAKYFTRSYFLGQDDIICTYPLLSTILLGLFYTLLISYVACVGSRMLYFVINKGLRRRVYWLISSVLLLPSFRVLLLGFSVLPRPGNVSYETIVFLAFILMLSCMVVGIVFLVYYPVADSLALRDLGHNREMADLVPYDDYYYDGVSLIANQGNRDVARNSDASAKRGSISFRSMIRDEAAGADTKDAGFPRGVGALRIGSPPSGSSPSASKPMLPLRELLYSSCFNRLCIS